MCTRQMQKFAFLKNPGVILVLTCLLKVTSISCLSAAEFVGTSPTPLTPSTQPLPAAYFAAMADVKQRYKLFDEAKELYSQAIGCTANQQEKTQYQIQLAETLDAAGTDSTELWTTLAKDKNAAVVYRAKVALASKLAKDGKKDDAAAVLEDITTNCPIQAYRAAAAVQLAKLVEKASKLPEYKGRLAKEPKNKDLLNLILALQQDDASGRNETLAIAYKADPHDLDIMQRYGQSLTDAGKVAEAEKFYAAIRTDYPSFNRDASGQLARLAMHKGDAAVAAELVKQSAAEMSDDIQKSLGDQRSSQRNEDYRQQMHGSRSAIF